MRMLFPSILLVMAGCSSYQPAPPGVPEQVNAHCNLLGSMAGDNDIAVRANCFRYWAATGQLPMAVASR